MLNEAEYHKSEKNKKAKNRSFKVRVFEKYKKHEFFMCLCRNTSVGDHRLATCGNFLTLLFAWPVVTTCAKQVKEVLAAEKNKSRKC